MRTFPINASGSPRLIGDDLISVVPMAGPIIEPGAKVMPFDPGWSDVKNLQQLNELIRQTLNDGISIPQMAGREPIRLGIKKEWLSVDKVVHMPLNVTPGIHYESVSSFQINAYDPTERGCVRYGGVICELRPSDFRLVDLLKLTDKIKREK